MNFDVESAVKRCLAGMVNNGTVYVPVALPFGGRLELWGKVHHYLHQGHRLLVVRGVDMGFVKQEILPVCTNGNGSKVGSEPRVIPGWDRERLSLAIRFNFADLGPYQPLLDPTCVIVL